MDTLTNEKSLASQSENASVQVQACTKTTRKHTASGSIYCMGKDMKINVQNS